MRTKEEVEEMMKKMKGVDKGGWNRIIKREVSISGKLQESMGAERMTVEEIIKWLMGE